MAEDAALGHRGHVPLQDVEVRAADRGRVDADDHVGRLLDPRVRDAVPCLLAGSAENECLHTANASTRPLLGRYSGDGAAVVNAGGALSGTPREEAKPSKAGP